jgi:ABC-type sulfate transport system substrate-binding protein
MMDNYIDKLALATARDIEDEFSKGHSGGVTQRRAAVQGLVANAIKMTLRQAIDNLAAAVAENIDN